VSSRGQSITLIVHAVIALALIGVAAVLAWHGTIDGQALTAILGTAVGLVGGSAGTLAVVGFQQSPPGSPTVTAQTSESVPAGP
jgi:hypothetical protein